MTTREETDEFPVAVVKGSDGELHHVYCCDRDWSLCRTFIRNMTEGGPRPKESICVVCDELADIPCEVCGG